MRDWQTAPNANMLLSMDVFAFCVWLALHANELASGDSRESASISMD